MAIKLTKRTVDGLATTNPKGVRFFDSELRGFGVLVMPNGLKSFFIRYGGRANRKRMSIGRFGEVTVEAARTLAQKVLAQSIEAAALGRPDPSTAKKRREKGATFAEWHDLFMADVKLRKKSWREDERYLALARKAWGARLLVDIEPSDVTALARKLSSTPIAARRLLASVSACFAAALEEKKIPSNPAAGVSMFRENPPRDRVLDEAELGRLILAVEAEKARDLGAWAAFRLMLETGARVGEVLGARWADVDLDGQRWSLPDPKAGVPQNIPLAALTVEWLRPLKELASSEYVIPAAAPERKRKVKPVAGSKAIAKPAKDRFDLRGPWERVKLAANLEDVNLHDLRRTFGTLVTRTAGLHMASLLLRHSDPRVTARVYAHLGDDEKRAAVAVVLPFMRRTG